MIYRWNKFNGGLITIKKLPILTLFVVWLIVLLSFITGCTTLTALWERPSQAQLPNPDTPIPAITLEPAAGMVNTPVTVFGRGWSPDSSVIIYLAGADENKVPGYAVASAIADAEGRFFVTIVISADPRWESSEVVKIIARAAEEQATTHTFFSLIDLSSLPTGMPITRPEPAITPTGVVQGPAPTPQPGRPLVTATTALNIRSGPGTNYPVLGLLQADQSAEVLGISPDGNWWQIKSSRATDGRGWVSAKYVTAQNTGNVAIAQPPAWPSTPASQVSAINVTDWRGEYYNNLNLSGAPTVVRNDVVVNFDWGNSAPATGIGVDNFSVRWTRRLNFPAGTYRFYARVDDGVRLWIDGNLVIDSWHDTAPTTYSADVTLTDGLHGLRMEYYERTGAGLAQLAWEWLEAYPDWKGEYFNNPSLSGMPVLVRNDPMPKFSWGPSSPGPGVPADNFSVRWTRDMYFSAGTYRFKVSVDDGARLWLDNNLIIDQWHVSVPKTFRSEITLTEGFHRVRLEYFDAYYDGQVHLDWERLSTDFPDWKAEYFDNRKLEGKPTLVRNETQINYNWGTGSPAAGIPADNFSARWTRKANFQSGVYTLRVKVDDGVRLWFDDSLVIDSWQDGEVRTLEAEHQVSEGQHRLKVEYYERGGDARIELSWQKKDVPANQAPQANAGGPYTVDEGSQVTFDGQRSRDPDGNVVSYEWDFDYKDGAFTPDAFGPTAGTRYPDGPASISVALRVTDDKGASNVAVTSVTVRNMAPTAEAGGPYVGQVGRPITLAGTATDPGLIDQAGLPFRWDFGDGSQGSGPVVSHSYAQAGNYTVVLTVRDKDGAEGVDTAAVQVTASEPLPLPKPPTAIISDPGSDLLVGQAVNFNGSNSNDSDGVIVSYDWSFGDGGAGTGENTSHVYSAAGNYTVSLTVTDNSGLKAKTTLLVRIKQLEPLPEPPTAIISDPGGDLLVGKAVDFSGSSSNDSDGVIVSYEWDFGDGSLGTDVRVSHVYNTAGNYTVSLAVTDNSGLTAKTSLLIQIKEPAPQPQPPTAVISDPGSDLLVGQAIDFTGSGSNDSDGVIVSYEWSFGDGDTGTGENVSHVYSTAGSYTVSMTVTDDSNLMATATWLIQINEPVEASNLE